MDDDCQVVTAETVQTTEDDDPLVAEIDIHLTRLFADQLYLFQYPLRSNHLQFENDITFVGARLKPKNKLVQLDYAFDTQSRFHCTDHEEKISKNWTTKSDESHNRNLSSIDRLTFASTNATLGENYKRFAVGILTPDGIQLSPLNAIFQLRPNFDTTSSVLAQNSALLAQQQSIAISDDDDNEINPLKSQLSSLTDDSATDDDCHNQSISSQKPAGELVTMRFWRPEARSQREKKMRSYNYLERARNEERWIDLAYYAPNEFPAMELLDRWIALGHHGNNRVPIRWRKTISIRDYFAALFLDKKLLFHEPVELERIAPSTTNNVVEQKPLIVPPTRPKKKKKIDLDPSTKSNKTTKKTTRKSRSASQKATDSTTSEHQQTTSSPLSSVSLPNTIIKQDPETIQNELLSFMKRRFSYRPYFKLSEINIAIKLELISSPRGHPLASGVTEASILRAAAEIGAIHVNKKWPKNLKQEPVFINAQMGEKYDVLRRYVAELLEKCDSFQFTELRSRIKQENQTQQFPVHEVKKFVKDHCITRSSRKGVLYCVRGTLVK